MRIFHDPDKIQDIRNAVVTTGSFDGVHVGHKMILKRLRKLADDIGGESVLITFHPHPRKILFPETAGRNLFLINSQKEKTELLQKTGLDNLLVIPFTLEFSKMSSFDFIRKIIVGKLHAKKVIVGFNHHFGHNQEGGYEVLYELGKFHGFSVEEIPEQDIENETVSSTRVRKALMDGKIQRANAYLDHFYMIIAQLQLLRPQNPASIPSYHVLIEEECKLIPPPGTYAVSILCRNQAIKGMVYVQDHSSSGYTRNLGRYVKLFPIGNLHYKAGEPVCLYFHKLIREMQDTTIPADDELILMEDKPLIEELIY